MNKISYELKNSKALKKTAVRLIYYSAEFAGGAFRYYTGESVNPKDWPGKIDKGTRSVLNRITAHFEQLITDYKIKNEPLTEALLRLSLDNYLRKDVSAPNNSLHGAMLEVIGKMERGDILTPNEKRYSAGSLKTYRFTADFICGSPGDAKRRGLKNTFDPYLTVPGVTIETYKKFINWCQKQDYSTNYIGSQIKNWKRLGKIIGGNAVYDQKAFRKIGELTDDIYLDEKELESIYKLKLPLREDLARDWFILDCFTGLRVSDLVLLDAKRNLNKSRSTITIASKKTGEKVIIPVHPYVRKILDKYRGFPPAITDVEINRVIKVVAEKAGIDDSFLFTITKGGKRVDSYMKKWEMVSCHTARRSLVTNLLKAGVPRSVVMKLTGIKSDQTLSRYDKLSVQEAARIAAGLEFFK
jgi:integrase